jgi:hypothetical protein
MKSPRARFRTEFIYTSEPLPRQIAWYKWEFLRRNPLYASDYQKFMGSFGHWFKRRSFWYEEDRRLETWTESDEDYFYERIAPVILKICKKWKIGNLFPPEWRFNKRSGLRSVGGKEKAPPTAIAAELNWDLPYMHDLFDRGFTGTSDSAQRYGNLVLLEFDLNWPMKDLERYSKYVLGRALENYRDECKELGIKIPNSRRRLEDYDTHLSIWDLKQSGRSVSEIAKLIFPFEISEGAVQKVRDQLKAARKLILGGYAEIR